MTRVLAALSLVLAPLVSHAVVDMKSANYADNWVDMQVPGIGYDLRVSRTYNSRSVFNGLFGYGWCSDFETRIEVTPEGNFKVTECGAGMEVLYTPKNFNPAKVDATIHTIIKEVKNRHPEYQPDSDYFKNLEKDMKTDDFMREEFARRLNLKGKIENGVTYAANGREAETVVLKNGLYTRTLASGSYEVFDPATGRLVQMFDRNHNYLKLQWNKDVLAQVVDNLGRKLNFKLNPQNRKVSEISGPNGMLSKYTFKGDDLVEVVDSKHEKYKYAYDELHHLARIDFSDKTYKAITYDKDKHWVLSLRNRKGCLETYDYEFGKEDLNSHISAKAVKKCGETIASQGKYDFFHRERPDKTGQYLYRVRTVTDGSTTDIIYHEVFGKPVSIVHDSVKVDYTYDNNGRVKTKKEPGLMTTFEYQNPCQKVSQVAHEFFDPGKKGTSPEKTSLTKFSYDPAKCNLIAADNGEGQRIKIQYDMQGRISQIEDQANQLVKIQYEGKFGKPWIVTRPGLGTVKVSYKSDGGVASVDSKEGPNVAVQVSSVFNNFLDIIEPATSEAPL